jgi:hypothetical protein
MITPITKWNRLAWLEAILICALTAAISIDAWKVFQHQKPWTDWLAIDGMILMLILGFLPRWWIVPIQFAVLAAISWSYVYGKPLTQATLIALPLYGKLAILACLAFGLMSVSFLFKRPGTSAPSSRLAAD